MGDVQGICFEPTYKLLVCKIHGNGVHSTKDAIKRHLCGPGHRCRGEKMKQAISTLTSLPLNSLAAVLNAQPAIDVQPLTPPLLHLRVLQGWSCIPCKGQFLTSSLEIIQRHAASGHGRQRGQQLLWEACELQSFFSETKDRRYFRVAGLPAATTSKEEQACEHHEHNRVQYFQAWRKKVGQEEKVTTNINSCSELVPIAASGKKPWALQTAHSQPSRGVSSPLPSITFRHPYTHHAQKCVPLSVSRIDNLLKSEAFRTASAPLFDGSHVDTVLDMRAVFPQSDQEPIFLNALLYSIVQITNRGSPTIEGFSLLGRTIKLLNEKLTSPHQMLSQAVIGAIMMLQTTSYKTCDLAAHDTHAQGLSNALEFITRRGKVLTPDAKRAMFWLDLYGAELANSKRQMSYSDVLDKVTWQREICPGKAPSLPIGFIRHQEALPRGLLECISDLIELQAFLRL